MMPSYRGQNVWIIGASSGIGRALAIDLAQRGATLALSARRRDQLERLRAELGGTHHIFPLDVSDSNAVLHTTCSVRDQLSRIDRIIFMAAVYDPAPVSQLSIKVAHESLAVNLGGLFRLCARPFRF